MTLNIDNIYKSFKDKKVLDDINTSFETGKIYGLLGRNGAGKSTLMRIISNRIFPDQGKVTLDLQEIYKNPELFKYVFVSSEDNMFPSDERCINIFKMLCDFAPFDYQKMLSLSEEFGLNTKTKWEKLSTGYRTIFNDIIALTSPATFIFYDEPILGLDANHRELFYEKLLHTYSEDKCIVVATHLIDEIANIIDSVIIIDHGKIVIDKDKDKLLSNIYLVSGVKEDVDLAIKHANIIKISNSLQQTKAIVEGYVEDSNVLVEHLDLQKYFIEMTK